LNTIFLTCFATFVHCYIRVRVVPIASSEAPTAATPRACTPNLF